MKEEEFQEFQFNKVVEEGKRSTIKYFDRIHDKVFKFNNILIGGYFFLARFDSATSYYMLVIPIVNLVHIVYLEYRMMEQSRFASQAKDLYPEKLKKFGKAIDKTKRYSFYILSTTAIVTIIFIIQIYLFQSRTDQEAEKKTAYTEMGLKNESFNFKKNSIFLSLS